MNNQPNTCVTKKGAEWESKNTTGLTVMTVLGLGFGAFFQMAQKTGQDKWKKEAIIYTVLFIASIFLTVGFGFIIYYPLTLIRYFKAKNEFLLRLEAIEDLGVDPEYAQTSELKDKIKNEYYLSNDYSANTNSQQVISNEAVIKNNLAVVRGQVIDINTCSDDDLEALSSFSAIQKIKIKEYKKEHGGFNNFDEFASHLELKPHQANQARSLVSFSAVNNNNTNRLETQRKSDAGADNNSGSLKSSDLSGRKLDF